MAPKRPAPPPPPPPADSSEDTTSGSSDEEAAARPSSPPPAQSPPPKKPASAAEDSDEEEEEEEEEESSGSESDDTQPTQKPSTPAPSFQPKPPAPNRRVASESESDTDDSESDADEPDHGDGANGQADNKNVKAAAEPDKIKAKTTAEPDRKKAKPTAEPDKEEKATGEPDKKKGMGKGKATAEPDQKKAKPMAFSNDSRSPFRRTWSLEDEVTILEALADHRKKHGSLPQADVLAASLSDRLDNVGCNRKDLADKMHKLKRKFDTAVRKVASGGGLPAKEHDLRLYNLSKEVWVGKARDAETLTASNGGAKAVNNGGQTEGNSGHGEENAVRERREYDELRKLYPNLADEVDGIEQAHPCGRLLKRALGVIGDAHARALDTKIRKQRVAETKIHMRRTDLTKEVTKTLLDLLKSE